MFRRWSLRLVVSSLAVFEAACSVQEPHQPATAVVEEPAVGGLSLRVTVPNPMTAETDRPAVDVLGDLFDTSTFDYPTFRLEYRYTLYTATSSTTPTGWITAGGVTWTAQEPQLLRGNSRINATSVANDLLVAYGGAVPAHTGVEIEFKATIDVLRDATRITATATNKNSLGTGCAADTAPNKNCYIGLFTDDERCADKGTLACISTRACMWRGITPLDWTGRCTNVAERIANTVIDGELFIGYFGPSTLLDVLTLPLEVSTELTTDVALLIDADYRRVMPLNNLTDVCRSGIPTDCSRYMFWYWGHGRGAGPAIPLMRESYPYLRCGASISYQDFGCNSVSTPFENTLLDAIPRKPRQRGSFAGNEWASIGNNAFLNVMSTSLSEEFHTLPTPPANILPMSSSLTCAMW